MQCTSTLAAQASTLIVQISITKYITCSGCLAIRLWSSSPYYLIEVYECTGNWICCLDASFKHTPYVPEPSASASICPSCRRSLPLTSLISRKPSFAAADPGVREPFIHIRNVIRGRFCCRASYQQNQYICFTYPQANR